MGVMRTESGQCYANPPAGSEYISGNGVFMKRIDANWYYWCTYHKTWRYLESRGVKCYKLEKA